MNKFDECQRPFSPCWCETRPKNPHCKKAVDAPIDSLWFILPMLAIGMVIAYRKIKHLM